MPVFFRSYFTYLNSNADLTFIMHKSIINISDIQLTQLPYMRIEMEMD